MGDFLDVFTGADTPKVDTAAEDALEADKKKTAAQRRTLFETEGGAAGEELTPNQVRGRNTLLGN
jgi:hypothetical protein